MADKIDLKKLQKGLWKNLKEASTRLEGVGREAKDIFRRGESELVKVSKMGRAQMEILALGVKKEQLYRQIGMKVWQLSSKGKLTTDKLGSLCKELNEINKNVKKKKRALSKALKKV